MKVENWTSLELFNYLVSVKIIKEKDDFEKWKHFRNDMMDMVKRHQNLINELEKLKNFTGVNGATIQLAVDLAKQCLEKEKQMIINTYWAGLNGSINDYSEAKVVSNEIINIKNGGGAEQYYNETYETIFN